MVVESAVGQARDSGNLTDACILDTLLREHVNGAVDQRVTGTKPLVEPDGLLPKVSFHDTAS